LHALGMRAFQLTYNYRNLLGDGYLERTNAGFSEFGVDVMRRMNEVGVLIVIAALGYVIGPDPGGATTIEHYADHIEHAVSVAGHEHVALSTDFPPQGIASWATRESWYEPRLKVFKPSYEVRWPPWIPELDSTDRFGNVIEVLSRRGWRMRELERLLGSNWMRLFRDTIG
jgi:membrane dipeptidase